MADPGFFDFLEAALAEIECECPRAYDRMLDLVGAEPLHLCVDSVARDLVCTPLGLRLRAPSSLRTCELHTSRATIARLVDGELGLLDALLEDALCVRAGPDSLLDVHELMTVFLQGAIRTRGLPELLDEYLGRARRPRGVSFDKEGSWRKWSGP